MNHFELFNIEPAYELNAEILESAYLTLQKKYHPDNCNGVEEQLEAVEKTIAINEAYDILKDEVLLLIYYVNSVLNINLDDKKIQEKMTQEDFLYLLDLQEQIANNPIKINEYKQLLKKKTSTIALRLKETIKSNNLEEINNNLAKLIFFNKSLKHI